VTDGRKIWEFKANAAIKGSPSFHDGLVYVGNYQSGMLALHAKAGTVAWRTNTTKEAGGKGGFCSSPAIAFGHVYAARADGVVFAFDRESGKIAWTLPDRRLRLRLAAVAKVPGGPATVYIGSENGRLYALRASNGHERWHTDGHRLYVAGYYTFYGLEEVPGTK
jgi:outer membrane protein assembly factor BamB